MCKRNARALQQKGCAAERGLRFACVGVGDGRKGCGSWLPVRQRQEGGLSGRTAGAADSGEASNRRGLAGVWALCTLASCVFYRLTSPGQFSVSTLCSSQMKSSISKYEYSSCSLIHQSCWNNSQFSKTSIVDNRTDCTSLCLLV